MSSAWAIIEDQSEILMIKRSFMVGRGGQWCPPGGSVREGEEEAVACVRETFEETALRVSIRKHIATFNSYSHYFLCKLHSPRDAIRLRARECVSACWVNPRDLLALGTIMDLRRILPVLREAGLSSPPKPEGLELCYPDPPLLANHRKF